MIMYSLFIMISCNPVKKEVGQNNIDISFLDKCSIGICGNEKNKINFDSANHFFTKENLNIVGPIAYLNYLKKFSCHELDLPSCRFPENWIKIDHLTKLKLLLDDTTPCPKIFIPSIKSYTLDSDSAYIKGSNISIEAKRLINSYYIKYYPCPY